MMARISGWGAALAPKVVTNDDLAAELDTSHEWIIERTGIRERRIGGTTTGLACDAGRAALERAGCDPASIDLTVVCTTTPDEAMPATASAVQHELGTAGGAFDLNAACAGFVYGLVTAAGLVGAGAQRVLVIGAETLSRITDWTDRRTAVLFGDGAGAVVVDGTPAASGRPGPGRLLGWDLGSDGSLRHLLRAPLGGTIEMDGPEVFRRAVRVMATSSERALARAGVPARAVSLVIPHQANARIISSAADRLGIGSDRVMVTVEHSGNTSAASIPMALAEAADAGRLAPGDVVLLTGFGAGMTWASAVVEWSP